ncbi:hypothetical protein HY442_01875 [Candidatus Parcubacteria bacterium]|nr:hypothetical protein [Candidatus Parcubacteria bacterium]MBI4099259.1 hypothetical protein [Candidatus Parcubacteria bacterium]
MRFLLRWFFRLVLLGVLALAAVVAFAWWQVRTVPQNPNVRYGVTFSAKRAEDLFRLDWRRAYVAVLDDLKVRRLRIPAYWDRIEKESGVYDWADLDFQMKEAETRNASVLLAVGLRLPGWPECHMPGWAKSLNTAERETKIMAFIERVVERYKSSRAIWGWQVENEPFLFGFGECPVLDLPFLDKEIALVRKLDDRAVVITDSGELGRWIRPARRADIFGTTMYRTVWDRRVGYVHYPMGPVFFRIKAWITEHLSRVKRIIVVELQAEPWGPKQIPEISIEEMAKSMNVEKFRDIIRFERETGFDEVYWWGVEWWYWMKMRQGKPEMWEEAARLFVQQSR